MCEQCSQENNELRTPRLVSKLRTAEDRCQHIARTVITASCCRLLSGKVKIHSIEAMVSKVDHFQAVDRLLLRSLRLFLPERGTPCYSRTKCQRIIGFQTRIACPQCRTARFVIGIGVRIGAVALEVIVKLNACTKLSAPEPRKVNKTLPEIGQASGVLYDPEQQFGEFSNVPPVRSWARSIFDIFFPPGFPSMFAAQAVLHPIGKLLESAGPFRGSGPKTDAQLNKQSDEKVRDPTHIVVPDRLDNRQQDNQHCYRSAWGG